MCIRDRLKPVDPFFSKHGAGTELPFKVTGTRSEPRFGLDLGQKAEAAREPSPVSAKSTDGRGLRSLGHRGRRYGDGDRHWRWLRKYGFDHDDRHEHSLLPVRHGD